MVVGESSAAAVKRKKRIKDDENSRIHQQAISLGMLARSVTNSENMKSSISIPLSKDLLACSGNDIVKRGSRSKKSSYLFAFPGTFKATALGIVGSLEQLDTLNPVLYLNFDCGNKKEDNDHIGRIKMPGQTLFSNNKLLMFQCRSSQLLLQEVFDKLIVFPEFFWIGTKEENPDEHPIPIPDGIAILGSEPLVNVAAAATVTCKSKNPKASSVKVPEEGSGNSESSDDEEEEQDNDDDNDDTAAYNPNISNEVTPTKRTRPQRSTPRINYSKMADDDDDDDDDDRNDAENEKNEIDEGDQAECNKNTDISIKTSNKRTSDEKEIEKSKRTKRI